MRLITSTWKETKTFKMIPATDDCPFVECIFDPQLKILAVVGKNKKESWHVIPRLDNNGDPELRKGSSRPDRPYKEERRSLETYHEYYIENQQEAVKFIQDTAVNAGEYDFMQYFEEQK